MSSYIFLGFAQERQASQKRSLADCIAYATKKNITIKQAELTKKSADVNLKQSEYSRLPSVSGSVSQKLTNGTSIDPITSNFVDQVIHRQEEGADVDNGFHGTEIYTKGKPVSFNGKKM